jgi:hypothetical protein
VGLKPPAPSEEHEQRQEQRQNAGILRCAQNDKQKALQDDKQIQVSFDSALRAALRMTFVAEADSSAALRNDKQEQARATTNTEILASPE